MVKGSYAHRGDALRAYLATPGLNLRLVNLPTYSPDCNADEAIWGWARQEATANLCLGTEAAVQEKVGDFFARLSNRREEVKRRGRTVLQARAAGQRPSHSFQPCQCRFHLGFGLGEARNGVPSVCRIGLRAHILSSSRGVSRRSGTLVSRMKWSSFRCSSDATSMWVSMMFADCVGSAVRL